MPTLTSARGAEQSDAKLPVASLAQPSARPEEVASDPTPVPRSEAAITAPRPAAAEAVDDPGVWGLFRTWRVAVGSGIVAAVAGGSMVMTISSWPRSLVYGLAPLAAWVVAVKLTGSERRAAIAAVAVALVVAGAAVAYGALHGSKAGPVGVAHHAGRSPEAAPSDRVVQLGSAPISTVVYRDLAWTLAAGGWLVAVDLPSQVRRPPIRLARGTRQILLCGSFLVLITASGTVTLRDAIDARRLRSYRSGGRPDRAACSPSRLWLARDGALVRLEIPALGNGRVDTKSVSQHVDGMLLWNRLLWLVDAETGSLVGYDTEFENAREKAWLGSGVDVVLGLGPRLVAVHREISCLRSIAIGRSREQGRGIPLTGDAAAAAGDGRSIVVADYDSGQITLIGPGRTRTLALPFGAVRVATLAFDDRWVVIGDESQDRLLVLPRSALYTLERVRSPRRLPACR
jgi:hypothetical protein